MDLLPVSPFISLCLCFYLRYLRAWFLEKNPHPETVSARVFVTTNSGTGLSASQVTRSLQRSCSFHLDCTRKPTALSLRHMFATYYWKSWSDGTFWTHVRTREHFLSLMAARLNTGVRMLKDIYISMGVVMTSPGDTVVPFPRELEQL
jgi:hypothetical protein